MSGEAVVLRRAVFTPRAVLYYRLQTTLGIGIGLVLVGAVLAPFTFGLSLLLLLVPAGVWWVSGLYYRVYFARLECELTERKLRISKGVIFRVEKAIPLDKITDMSMKQGPLLRHLNLEAMGVETAGGTGAAGSSLVSLIGIEGSAGFRAAVFEQRDLVVAGAEGVTHVPARAEGGDADTLREIRDAVLRIESRLGGRDGE